MDKLKEEAYTGLRISLEIFGREFLGPWYPEYNLEGYEKILGEYMPLTPELFAAWGGGMAGGEPEKSSL